MAFELLLHDGKDLSETDGEPLKVFRMDEADINGAHHEYTITDDSQKQLFCGLQFQNGAIPEVGVNGCHNESLIEIVIDRLESFEKGPFPCDENHMAIACLQQALGCLKARTLDRMSRGVEGKSEA